RPFAGRFTLHQPDFPSPSHHRLDVWATARVEQRPRELHAHEPLRLVIGHTQEHEDLSLHLHDILTPGVIQICAPSIASAYLRSAAFAALTDATRRVSPVRGAGVGH